MRVNDLRSEDIGNFLISHWPNDNLILEFRRRFYAHLLMGDIVVMMHAQRIYLSINTCCLSAIPTAFSKYQHVEFFFVDNWYFTNSKTTEVRLNTKSLVAIINKRLWKMNSFQGLHCSQLSCRPTIQRCRMVAYITTYLRR